MGGKPLSLVAASDAHPKSQNSMGQLSKKPSDSALSLSSSDSSSGGGVPLPDDLISSFKISAEKGQPVKSPPSSRVYTEKAKWAVRRPKEAVSVLPRDALRRRHRQHVVLDLLSIMQDDKQELGPDASEVDLHVVGQRSILRRHIEKLIERLIRAERLKWETEKVNFEKRLIETKLYLCAVREGYNERVLGHKRTRNMERLILKLDPGHPIDQIYILFQHAKQMYQAGMDAWGMVKEQMERVVRIAQGSEEEPGDFLDGDISIIPNTNIVRLSNPDYWRDYRRQHQMRVMRPSRRIHVPWRTSAFYIKLPPSIISRCRYVDRAMQTGPPAPSKRTNSSCRHDLASCTKFTPTLIMDKPRYVDGETQVRPSCIMVERAGIHAERIHGMVEFLGQDLLSTSLEDVVKAAKSRVNGSNGTKDGEEDEDDDTPTKKNGNAANRRRRRKRVQKRPGPDHPARQVAATEQSTGTPDQKDTSGEGGMHQ